MEKQENSSIKIKWWLDKLYYDIGKQQFNYFVSGLYKTHSTKWKKYLEVVSVCDHDEDDKLLWINQRQILGNEVVLDLEEKNQLKPIIEILKKWDVFFYVFETGSRGYHINLFFSQTLTTSEKSRIIDYFGSDPQKSSEKTMIALEYVPHWKSGKIKQEILI